MSNAVTLVPPTYPELESEVYRWLEERETMPPPSDDEQFELEVESLLG
jgi:hypothetical protein